MNTKTIIAVILIVAGILVLGASGITFKTPGQSTQKTEDLGSLQLIT